MNVRQLRYFVQIVESGSMAKASRQLYVAQPALSQQIARLEEEVGKALLVRSSRGVVTTENGEALYHHAKFLLRQMDEAFAVAQQDTTDLSGRVALGLAPTTVCRIGLPLMLRMKEKYPRLTLNVIEGLSGNLEQLARNNELDLVVLFRQGAASDLTMEPLLEEELFLILPAGSTLVPSDRESLSLKEIAEIPLILPSPGHGLRRRISVEFERNDIPLYTVAEVDSLPLLLSCVAHGLGATIKPISAIHGPAGDPQRWRCLRISDVRMTRTSYLYSLPPHMISRCVRVVRNELRSLVRDHITAGEWQGVSLLVDNPA